LHASFILGAVLRKSITLERPESGALAKMCSQKLWQKTADFGAESGR